MCGINGHAAAPHSPQRPEAALQAVETMNRALLHRGPDGGGTLQTGFASLGMRRLSIVDVARGHQPMRSADGRYALVYNGEIYDCESARRELAARGVQCATRSDTEVLLHMLALDGQRALPRLNGMFAFAFADCAEQSLLLARDPIGIKPLYYASTAAGDLVFSSELASLVAHPLVPRRLDRRSLALLLHDRYVADPWTLLEGVYQLEPGHCLHWKDGRIRITRFARTTFAPEPMDEFEAQIELTRLLDEAVTAQLEADVPVGVFLSGGVDSSTVAAFAARASKTRPKSFSVGFARADHDESALAREVAGHLGLEHHEVQIEDASFDEADLDRVLDHAGQPLGDTSCIPAWVVSKLASRQVKVVLSGDGGDELFGGYDHMFWAARVRRMRARMPDFVRRAGRAVLTGVSPVTPALLAEPARRARKGLDLTFCEPDEQLRRLRALWSTAELRQLLGADVELRRQCEPDPDALARLEPEEYAMLTLARTFLPGAILAKVDRMSMAHSLEVRVPLLDARIVAFARRLPLELKIRRRTGKHLLREAGRPFLPAAVYAHRKQGFSLPVGSWLNARFFELAADLYAPGSRAAALFERRSVERVFADARHPGGRGAQVSASAAATRAWVLALFARWMERHAVSA